MRWWCSVALGLTAVGCDSSSPRLSEPTLASIEVVTSTEGSPLDPDGYALSLDGGPSQLVALRDTLLLRDVTAGLHTLELSGISPDCRVQGENPRPVTASAGETAYSQFALFCSTPGTGRLTVSTFTYGTRPDSYLVHVSRGPSVNVGPEDQVTLFQVPTGTDTVTLERVPFQCDVIAPNPRVLVIPVGGERGTLFKVRCPG
jgi:hypothetical protein